MKLHQSHINDLLDEIESPDADYLRARRKKINKQNKDRARRMEQRVAEALGGKRTPLSGAGSIKGDGFTSTPVGLVILECKLSSQLDKNGPTIKLETLWFTKLREDVHATRAAFGVLIVHFHDTRMDTVFIEERHAEKLGIDHSLVDQELDYSEHRSKYITMNTLSFAPMFRGGTMKLIVPQGRYFVCSLKKVVEALERFEYDNDKG